MRVLVSPKPQARGPSPRQFAQRMVHIPRNRFAHRLSGKFNGRRDRRMRRHARQPAELIGAEAQHVVETGIGTVELERGVELALAAEHAGRQLVCEAPVALGEACEVAVAGVRQWRSRPDRAENLERRASRGSCFLNPASPWSGMTAWRLRGAAYGRRGRPPGRRSSRDASRSPWQRDPARPRSRCSSESRPRPAPS